MDTEFAIQHNIQPEFHDSAGKAGLDRMRDVLRYTPDLLHQSLSDRLPEFCREELFRDMDRATLKDIGQIASRGSQPGLKHRMPPASVVHHHDSHVKNGPA